MGLTTLVFAMEMGMHGGWTLLLNGVEVGRSVSGGGQVEVVV